MKPFKYILTLIISTITVLSFGQIKDNSALHFQITHSQRQIKERKIYKENYILYYYDRNVVPIFYKGEKLVDKDKYMTYILEEKDDKIVVRYNDDGEVEEHELFSLNPMEKVTVSVHFDFPIMFFDEEVVTRYIKKQELKVFDQNIEVYKFKMEGYPDDGYSIVYIDAKSLIPVQYEIYSFTSDKRLKFYTSVELTKIDNTDASYIGLRDRDLLVNQ